jgi:hypothetical protein
VSASVLAAELLDKNIWYPTILGILVVVFAIGLFCGSLYLLLGTNLGARLGFLVAFTGLMAFMVILTSLWVVTASPLNTLKGRIPAWKAVELITDPSKAKTAEVRDIEDKGRKVSAVEAANVKAAADENLIQVEALPSEGQKAQEAAIAQKYGRFQLVTDYKEVATYETGGGKPNPLDFELTHAPLYAVVQFCAVEPVDELKHPFGTTPPAPVCDKSSKKNGFLVLERDLGSLRVPPIVAWISAVLLFGLGLLSLHWRERDEQRAKNEKGTALTPAPAKA